MKNNIRIKDMIANSDIPAKLIRSAIQQFGGFDFFKECAEDVSNHGIDGGFHGFIYYMDTLDFYRRNKKEIFQLACDQSDEFGVDVIEMLKGFNCMKDCTPNEIFMAMTRYNENYTIIYNCLAWYAGEEVCRLYCEVLG